MANDDIGSQRQIGYSILGELRRVGANLSQSERLQSIVAIAQDFIDAYAAYLDALNVDTKASRTGEKILFPTITHPKEVEGDTDFVITIEYVIGLKDSLKDLHLDGIDCDVNPKPKACEIMEAWSRLVDSMFAPFSAANLPSSFETWRSIWDLFLQKRKIEEVLQGLLDGEGDESLHETISSIFGYNIELADSNQSWLDWEDELLNLLIANLHIAAFFQELLGANSGLSGLDVVRQIFAQNPDGERIRILLGNSGVGFDVNGNPLPGRYQGQVPLLSSGASGENQRTIFFGEDIEVATIVHEFGHQFDRWFQIYNELRSGSPDGLTDYLTDTAEDGNGYSTFFQLTRTPNSNRQDGYNLQSSLYAQGIITGFAAKELNPNEVFADLFMTLVLAGQEYEILSIMGLTQEEILVANGEFIQCGSERNPNATPPILPCSDLSVAWTDTEEAGRVRDALRELFLSFLSELGTR